MGLLTTSWPTRHGAADQAVRPPSGPKVEMGRPFGQDERTTSPKCLAGRATLDDQREGLRYRDPYAAA